MKRNIIKNIEDGKLTSEKETSGVQYKLSEQDPLTLIELIKNFKFEEPPVGNHSLLRQDLTINNTILQNDQKEYSLTENDYRFSDIIANGSTSSVYSGWLTKTNEPVAIKVINTKYNINPLITQPEMWFQKEHSILVLIDKNREPHDETILRYFGTHRGLANNPFYSSFVMQFANGGTLYQWIATNQREKISWNQINSLILDIAKGLNFLHHKCNLIHADLKSENILLHNDKNKWQAKIADYGLARELKVDYEIDKYDSIFAKDYAAPELRNPPKDGISLTSLKTFSSDIYSFTVIIFEIATNSTLANFRRLVEKEWLATTVKDAQQTNLETFKKFVIQQQLANLDKNNVPKKVEYLINAGLSSLPSERLTAKKIVTELGTGLGTVSSKLAKYNFITRKDLVTYIGAFWDLPKVSDTSRVTEKVKIETIELIEKSKHFQTSIKSENSNADAKIANSIDKADNSQYESLSSNNNTLLDCIIKVEKKEEASSDLIIKPHPQVKLLQENNLELILTENDFLFMYSGNNPDILQLTLPSKKGPLLYLYQRSSLMNGSNPEYISLNQRYDNNLSSYQRLKEQTYSINGKYPNVYILQDKNDPNLRVLLRKYIFCGYDKKSSFPLEKSLSMLIELLGKQVQIDEDKTLALFLMTKTMFAMIEAEHQLLYQHMLHLNFTIQSLTIDSIDPINVEKPISLTFTDYSYAKPINDQYKANFLLDKYLHSSYFDQAAYTCSQDYLIQRMKYHKANRLFSFTASIYYDLFALRIALIDALGVFLGLPVTQNPFKKECIDDEDDPKKTDKERLTIYLNNIEKSACDLKNKGRNHSIIISEVVSAIINCFTPYLFNIDMKEKDNLQKLINNDQALFKKCENSLYEQFNLNYQSDDIAKQFNLIFKDMILSNKVDDHLAKYDVTLGELINEFSKALANKRIDVCDAMWKKFKFLHEWCMGKEIDFTQVWHLKQNKNIADKRSISFNQFIDLLKAALNIQHTSIINTLLSHIEYANKIYQDFNLEYGDTSLFQIALRNGYIFTSLWHRLQELLAESNFSIPFNDVISLLETALQSGTTQVVDALKQNPILKLLITDQCWYAYENYRQLTFKDHIRFLRLALIYKDQELLNTIWQGKNNFYFEKYLSGKPVFIKQDPYYLSDEDCFDYFNLALDNQNLNIIHTIWCGNAERLQKFFYRYNDLSSDCLQYFFKALKSLDIDLIITMWNKNKNILEQRIKTLDSINSKLFLEEIVHSYQYGLTYDIRKKDFIKNYLNLIPDVSIFKTIFIELLKNSIEKRNLIKNFYLIIAVWEKNNNIFEEAIKTFDSNQAKLFLEEIAKDYENRSIVCTLKDNFVKNSLNLITDKNVLKKFFIKLQEKILTNTNLLILFRDYYTQESTKAESLLKANLTELFTPLSPEKRSDTYTFFVAPEVGQQLKKIGKNIKVNMGIGEIKGDIVVNDRVRVTLKDPSLYIIKWNEEYRDPSTPEIKPAFRDMIPFKNKTILSDLLDYFPYPLSGKLSFGLNAKIAKKLMLAPNNKSLYKERLHKELSIKSIDKNPGHIVTIEDGNQYNKTMARIREEEKFGENLIKKSPSPASSPNPLATLNPDVISLLETSTDPTAPLIPDMPSLLANLNYTGEISAIPEGIYPAPITACPTIEAHHLSRILALLPLSLHISYFYITSATAIKIYNLNPATQNLLFSELGIQSVEHPLVKSYNNEKRSTPRTKDCKVSINTLSQYNEGLVKLNNIYNSPGYVQKPSSPLSIINHHSLFKPPQTELTMASSNEMNVILLNKSP